MDSLDERSYQLFSPFFCVVHSNEYIIKCLPMEVDSIFGLGKSSPICVVQCEMNQFSIRNISCIVEISNHSVVKNISPNIDKTYYYILCFQGANAMRFKNLPWTNSLLHRGYYILTQIHRYTNNRKRNDNKSPPIHGKLITLDNSYLNERTNKNNTCVSPTQKIKNKIKVAENRCRRWHS